MVAILSFILIALVIVVLFTATISLTYIVNLTICVKKHGVKNSITMMDPITATYFRWWMTQRRVGKALGAIPIIGIVFVSMWFIFEFCSGVITWACFICSLVVFVPLWVMFFWFRNKRFPGRVVVA